MICMLIGREGGGGSKKVMIAHGNKTKIVVEKSKAMKSPFATSKSASTMHDFPRDYRARNMVKLSMSYLMKKGSPNAPKHSRDCKEHVRNLTHLYLQDQNIDSIEDISACKNLTVLYLQNNAISKVKNLNFASKLTHLFLQRNKLKKIEGLEALHSLRKLYVLLSHRQKWSEAWQKPSHNLYLAYKYRILEKIHYLGYNSISVVENLEGLNALQELHTEMQQLPLGEELHFDPRTIISLRNCLQILNVQGNALTSLTDLCGLDFLQSLNASHNNLTDVLMIETVISALPNLIELDLRDNRAVADYKACDKIIACSLNLRSLNGRDVSKITKDFIKKFEKNRVRTSITQKPSLPPAGVLASMNELSKNLPEGVTRDVAQSILKSSPTLLDSMAAALGHMGTQSNVLNVHTPTETTYHHFPAFKSTTSLHLDGHNLPRPFHRSLSVPAKRHHRSPVTLPSNIPGYCDNSNHNYSGKIISDICVTGKQRDSQHGDTGWTNDDIISRTMLECGSVPDQSFIQKMET